MAKWVINDGTLSDIADAIRAKKGTSSPIGVDDLAYEVSTISGGGGEIPLRDRLIIPDKYNTGCNCELINASQKFTNWNNNINQSIITQNNSTTFQNISFIGQISIECGTDVTKINEPLIFINCKLGFHLDYKMFLYLLSFHLSILIYNFFYHFRMQR